MTGKQLASTSLTVSLAAIAVVVGAVMLLLEQSSRTWKAIRENRIVNTARVGFELLLAVPVLTALLAGSALERKLKSPAPRA